MRSINDPIGMVLVIALVPMYLLAWISQVWFLAEVRRLEPAVWQSLARPRWAKALSRPVLAFVVGRHYRDLASRKLRRFGAYLRAIQLLTLILFLTLLVYIPFRVWLTK